MDINQEIQDLETRLAAAEEKKNNLVGQDQIEYQKAVDEYNAILNKLNEKQQELQGQQDREQKKQETIDSYVDVLPDMFEALLPKDVFSPLFGLTEYAEKRQQFLQLSHTYFAEQLDGIDKQHQMDLAQKDSKIQTATALVNGLQQQLDEANKNAENANAKYSIVVDELNKAENAVNELHTQIADLTTERDGLKADRDKQSEYINQFNRDYAAQSDKIAELEAELKEAKKPRESQPSQTLAEQINAIKSRNNVSADDMIARFNARQKSEEAKLQLPEIKPPAVEVSQFRSEDTASEPSGDQLPASQESEVNQFPAEVSTVSTTVASGDASADGQGEKTIEQRIEALEAAVFGKGQVA